jgi:hypothetical protein
VVHAIAVGIRHAYDEGLGELLTGLSVLFVAARPCSRVFPDSLGAIVPELFPDARGKERALKRLLGRGQAVPSGNV